MSAQSYSNRSCYPFRFIQGKFFFFILSISVCYSSITFSIKISRFTNYDLQHKEYPAGDEQRADEYAQGNFLV